MQRFTGTVKALCEVDIDEMRDWIMAIPVDDWPMQGRGDNGVMVANPEWHGFGLKAAPVVGWIMAQFPGCQAHQRMLSVVMSGHGISPHKDGQPDNWITRVHVPLTTDDFCYFNVDGKPYSMWPGFAYKVNTRRTHSVQNDGLIPRIHFMFDVRSA